MKKVLLFASGLLFFGATHLQAQNWVNKGNTLTGNGIIGINSNHSLLFETNNTERGRITNNGLWGIGTGTTLPDAKFQINSVTTRDPLRVQVNTVTKFLVSKAGGVSIGANVTPPVDGLYVKGNTNMGVAENLYDSKLHVENALVRGTGISTLGEFKGLFARATLDYGIGIHGVGSTGLYGEGSTYGVFGQSPNDGYGVYGISFIGVGVAGASTTNTGVKGMSGEGNGGYFISEFTDALYAKSFNEQRYAGYFEGDVFATGVYQGSDKNIKKNIEEMSNATSLISQLKPKYYQFRNDGKYASLMLPKGNHYGLLAQDVEEVLPTLVKETLHEVRDQKPMTAPKLGPDGKVDLSALNKEQASTEPKEKISIKAVNYTELIPIMIKGMQEQQAKIEELTLLVQKLSQKDNSAVSVKATDAYLSQSAPNPSKNSTRINYTIPTGSTKAQLVIINATGQQVKKISLNNSGSVEVDTTSLSAGTYLYSLFIDNTLVATEKMVVAK